MPKASANSRRCWSRDSGCLADPGAPCRSRRESIGLSPSPLTTLRALRDARGLRQIDVASMAGVDPTVVSRIESANGFLGVQVRSIVRIAAALKVSPVDLLPGLAAVPKLRD